MLLIMLVAYNHCPIRFHISKVNVLGSGFISSDMYQHGLFSALIKLPSDYTAGVVVAFYVSFEYSPPFSFPSCEDIYFLFPSCD
jgi:Glycosyl hydrolases family 16